jgi:ABC-type multidrug transport system ATPase subunit
VGDPELLCLDEPTTGLDPQSRRQIWEIIRNFRQGGRTVLLTTHYMDEAERLSDVLTVLARGRVVAHGTPRAVLGDLVGEHVVVVAAEPETTAALSPWLARHALDRPAAILGAWHLPLRAEALADFARAFPQLRYEVRVPTLDDLFLKLALEP